MGMKYKKFRQRLSSLLVGTMLAGAISPAGIGTVYAKQTAKQNWVKGEAIVCLTQPAAANYNLRAGGEDLLAGAEVLMELDSTGDSASERSTFGLNEEEQAQSLALVHSDRLDTASLIEKLEELPNVEFAEPNYIYHCDEKMTKEVGDEGDEDQTEVSSEDRTDLQWAYNSESTLGKSAACMDIPYWNQPSVENASGIVVAVVDTGVDYDHPDLHDNMWKEGGKISALSIMGGGTYGFNSAYNSNSVPIDDPMDGGFHGTHCAGIIAAQWDGTGEKAYGVSGAANGVSIMAVRTTGSDGTMKNSDILKGYEYIKTALENDVNVRAINNSWGGECASRALDKAVRECGKLGAVSVFSAGNEMQDADVVSKTFSAMKNNPYTIIVNAIDRDGNMADFSNYGAMTTDVAAPGVDIYSTIPHGNPALNLNPTKNDGGYEFTDSFSREDIEKINDGSNFFGYFVSPDEDIETTDERISIVNGAGEKSGNALAVQNMSSTGDSLIIKAENIPKDSKYFILSYCIPVDENDTALDAALKETTLTASVSIGGEKTEDYTHEIIANQWDNMAIPLSENCDFEDFQITISSDIELDAEHMPAFYVDRVLCSKEYLPFESFSGTSMAAPAVSGEVAILAAAFADESGYEPADKIAARVIGSVTPLDSQAGRSVSEGTVNVAKALNGETVPVLNSAVLLSGDIQEKNVQEDILDITGFFFGESAGKVQIDGQSVEIKGWTDDEILCSIPNGFKEGVHKVTVVSAKGSGHQYFEIGVPVSLYDRLPLPKDETSSFYSGIGVGLTGLGGDLYYICNNEENELSELWRYSVSQGEDAAWKNMGTIPKADAILKNTICTYQENVAVLAALGSDYYLMLYDPEENAPEENEWSHIKITDASDKEKDDFTSMISPSMIYNGTDLYVIGGYKQKDDEKKISNSIYRLNIQVEEEEYQAYASYVGCMKSSRISPLVFYTEDETMYVTGGYEYGITDSGYEYQQHVNGLEKLEVSQKDGVDDIQSTWISRENMPLSALSNFVDITGATVKNGMIITGPAKTDVETTGVLADTWESRFASDSKFTETDHVVSTGSLFQTVATAYEGTYYVLGYTSNSQDMMVFAYADADTIPQPGDVGRHKITVQTDGYGTATASDALAWKGEEVELKASPDRGYSFREWIVNNGDVEIASPTNATSSFMMPGEDVEITAHFEAVDTYALKVEGGSGSGNYAEGTAVKIQASAPPDEMTFKEWVLESGDAAVASPSNAQTVVTTGRETSMIRAVFVKIRDIIVKITDLIIKKKPQKVKYKLGEEFNSAGLVVQAKGKASSSDAEYIFTLNEDEYQLDASRFSSDEPGDYDIVVGYEFEHGEDDPQYLEKTFQVSVEDEPIDDEDAYVTDIKVKRKPVKLTYYQDEELNTTGMVVVAERKGTVTGNRLEDLILTEDQYDVDYDFSFTGRRKVTVSFWGNTKNGQEKEFKDQFNVTVKKSTSHSDSDSDDYKVVSSAGAASSGWKQQQNHAWKFQKADGSYAKNEWIQTVEHGVSCWYYIGTDETMQTGWFSDTADGYRYYMDPVTGKMATGWVVIDGIWYYFNEVSGVSGWRFDAALQKWSYERKADLPLGAWEEKKK